MPVRPRPSSLPSSKQRKLLLRVVKSLCTSEMQRWNLYLSNFVRAVNFYTEFSHSWLWEIHPQMVLFLLGRRQRKPCTERSRLISKGHLQFYSLPNPPSRRLSSQGLNSKWSNLFFPFPGVLFYTCRCSPLKKLKMPLKVLFLFLFSLWVCLKCSHVNQSHESRVQQTKLEWQIGLSCSAAQRPLLSSSGRLPKETVHVSTKANSKSLGYQSFGSKSGALRSLEARKVEKPP